MARKKNKKQRSWIIQRIRIQESNKRQRRQRSRRKKRRKKNQSPLFSQTVRIPRRFRRKAMLLSEKKLKPLTKIEYIQKKERLLNNGLPANLRYLLHAKESPFNLKAIRKEKFCSHGIIPIPESFSILDNANDSFLTFRKIISALFIENSMSVVLDYEKCTHVDLGTQVLLDIILKEFWTFARKSQMADRNKRNFFPISIGGDKINNEDIQKLLFSVGSPATLSVKERDFKDIIKYKLCLHDNNKEKDLEKRAAQKELDTTQMVDYVIECLRRMNKELTSEKLNDLCTVIGEILINAEEHSSTQYRFSIGYFKEEKQDEDHFGIFRLVILNFGQTIYQKFKSPDCPNQDIVSRMKELSESYTKRFLFLPGQFEEETLWTLYALQEGVTSVSTQKYKRGNGSIRFIDSFFNIKGSQSVDNISKMSILSGKTRIIFDGKYKIVTKKNNSGDVFNVMTFNQSDNIEDKPDSNYVYSAKHYFLGTMICAKILLNDDDIKQIK